jgi:protein required for attachment to host cells
MPDIDIPSEALILVGDGEKALLLRNKGSRDDVRLKVENILWHNNPASHEQGTDEPGRAFASVGTARSAMDETDWHELGEERFVTEVARRLNTLAHAKKFDALVVVAPPKVLGQLRKEFHKEVTDRITGELPKELTTHYLPAIEKVLRG